MPRFPPSPSPNLLQRLFSSSSNKRSSSSPTAALLSGDFHLRRFSSGNAARAAKGEKEPWWKESMNKVRNIGISAHIDSGKTTLTERVLFYTGRIHEIHEVRGRDGVGAKMDSMDLEREKGITIQSAATYCTWKDYKVNIIDTPGHVDFTIEVERALRVLDGAILVLCSVGGVQSQSITVDRQMRRYEVPRVAFINKLDRMGADPWKVLSQARAKLRHHSAAVQMPIGLEENFKGLIDLVHVKALFFHGSSGENVVAGDIPADMEELVAEKRRELIETVSEVDDVLAEKFLNDEPVTAAELEEAIRRATIAQKFVPVFMGSAFKNKGVQPLLDGVVSYLPCPTEVNNYALDQDNEEAKVTLTGSPDGPLVALAFKLEEGRFGQLTYLRIYEGVIKKGDFIINVNTKKRIKVPRLVRMHSNDMEDIQEAHAGEIVAVFGIDCASGHTFTDGSVKYTMTSMSVPEPVMSLAVQPVSKDSGGQFSKALQRFQKEDPTFRVGLDPDSNQTIISGMGELHLDIYVERMRREYKVDATVGKPRVNFRETITQRAEFDYLHKKQSGGAGQYGRVTGYVEPLSSDSKEKFEFENMIVGQAIPSGFIPAIEKGFKEAANSGSLIGHPVENIRIVLTDGASHAVDSSELAFKLLPRNRRVAEVAGKSSVMMEIRTPKTHKAKRVLEKRAPKLVENGKKTLILHGTKTSATVSSVLMELYRLKKGGAIKYSRRNENIRPFESGGETSLEFFSLKTDCSIFVYGSHSKKRPDNLVLGRMYDHHVYDLIEVGIENFKSLLSFSYDKKIAPHEGSKPFICFTGEGFENVQELKQLKEVLTDLFRGEVVENLNLTGLDRAYICTAVSPAKVFLTHCAIKLKKSGTIVPRIELVEVGPSMDLVIRRNRFPNEGLRKEAMKSSKDKPKKKVKNVDQDDVLGKLGRVYIPEQEVGKIPLPDKSKGVKRERREGKVKKNKEEGSASKKLKESE